MKYKYIKSLSVHSINKKIGEKMKKVIINALLGTAIILPNISIAMEGTGEDTPLKKEAKQRKKKFTETLPSTPQIEQKIASEIQDSSMSEIRKRLFMQKKTTLEKGEREEKKTQEFSKIDREIAEKRLEREKKKLKEETERKANQHQALIQEASGMIDKKQAEIGILSEQMNQMRLGELSYLERIKVLEEEADAIKKEMEEVGGLSEDLIRDMGLKLSQKDLLIRSAQTALEEHRVREEFLEVQLQAAKQSEIILSEGIKKISSGVDQLPVILNNTKVQKTEKKKSLPQSSKKEAVTTKTKTTVEPKNKTSDESSEEINDKI